MVCFMEMSVDLLEQAFLGAEANIARERARQVVALAALDRAQVQAIDGARTLAEWVAGRLDVAPETARDLVDAARLLADQPDRAAALRSGEDTFDRVLATARLAAAGASDTRLAASRGADINGVRRLTGLHRRISRRDEHRAFAGRYLVFQPTLDGTTCKLRGELPGDRAEAARRSLAARADSYPPLPDGTSPPRAARMADAFTDLVTGGSTGEEPVPVVTFTVDGTIADGTFGQAGAAVTGGTRVGPDTLHKLLCNGRIEVNVRWPDGSVDGVGPISRFITPRRRRAVIARDGGMCAVRGCRSRHRLQVHHILPRAAGGTDDPGNLVTLCWFHHQVVVHGYGYRIDPDSPPRRRRLVAPPGQRVPSRSPP